MRLRPRWPVAAALAVGVWQLLLLLPATPVLADCRFPSSGARSCAGSSQRSVVGPWLCRLSAGLPAHHADTIVLGCLQWRGQPAGRSAVTVVGHGVWVIAPPSP